MINYHFNVAGEYGKLGFTAEVRANSRAEAVEYLNDHLGKVASDEFARIKPGEDDKGDDETAIIYLQVWLNGIQVTDADIDEECESQ